MQSYIEDPNANPIGARLTTIFMFVLALVAFITAEQILTGWFALGERVNISRRDINAIEWIVIIASVLWGLAALRTAWGLFRRDASGWAWAQWVSFLTMLFGIALIMKSLLPVAVAFSTGNGVVPEGASALATFLSTSFLTGWALAGIANLVLGYLSYRYVTRDVIPDDSDSEKKQGALGTESKDMTPGQFVQNQLANSPSAGAIIGFLVIFLGFSFTTDLFLQPSSIASILTNISSRGIIAIGVTMLMISGEFDLSVGSMLGAVATFYMLFLTEGIAFLGIPAMPVLVATLAALLVSALLGAVNGIILVRTGIPSFIVTLGTLLAYRAIPLVAIPGGRILRYRDYFPDFPQLHIDRWAMAAMAAILLLIVLYMALRVLPRLIRNFSHNWSIRSNNGHFGTFSALWSTIFALIVAGLLFIVGAWLVLVIVHHLGQPEALQVGFFDIANGRWEFTFSQVTQGWFSIEIPSNANFRNAIVWWLILVVVFHIVLTQTTYGNAIYAVGGNAAAARAQGINVSRVKVTNYILLGLLVGITAVFETARNPGVDPLKGQLWELDVIAMTVIGGALLTGGYGSVVGTLLGVLIFGMLQTGLVLIGVNARLFQGIVGIILIVAVVLNTSVRRIPR